MRKIALALAIFGTTLLPALYSSPAHAQATRTWVSGVGDDANPCSRTAPCKTFAGAISKTLALGEIDCLDPGGFGALTITKSITIDCRYVSNGGVLVSGTNGIVVAAGPTDKVQLIGLDFEGVGSGLNGVQFNSGLVLIIQDCLIRNFTQNGVNVASSTSGAQVVILNSQISNNGTNGSNPLTGGVNVTAGVAALISDVLENNQNFGVQVTGSANVATFTRTWINPTGIVSVNSGQLISIGPSSFFGSGAPTTTITYK